MLAAVLLPAFAFAHAEFTPPARLLVVTDNNFPPYLFQREDGLLQGILKDKWALWSEKTGVPVSVEGMEWKAAQDRVLKGGADVIEALSYSEARTRLYEYSRPYAPIEAKVYFHRSITGINDVASLRGFRVGAKEGSACANWLGERGVNGIQGYSTSELLVKAAGAGDVRLFCMDSPAAQYFLFKQGLADEFRQTAPLYSSQFHWAVVKGRTELRDYIERGFDRIAPAELEQIDARWLGNPLRFPINTLYLTYAAFAALALLAAATLLVLWNRTLHRQVGAKTADLSAALESVKSYADETSDLYDNAPCGYHSLDANGVYIDINRTELDWLGCSRDEIVGKRRFGDFLTEAGRQKFDDAFGHLKAQGSVHGLEYELVGRDGSTRFVLASANMVLGPDGRYLRNRSTLYDITERKRAEEALRDSEARKGAILESALDCVITMDQAGRVVDFNRAAEHTFSRRHEDVVGCDLADLIIPQRMREAHRHGLARFVETGQGTMVGKRIELHALRVDGSEFPIEISISKCNLGTEVLFTAYLRDITEQREVQRQMQELNATLEHAVAQRTEQLTLANADLRGALDRLRASQDMLLRSEKLAALGRLVAGVAHELNTPIGNSMLSATTLHEQTETFAAEAGAGNLRRSALETFIALAREASAILVRNLQKAAELVTSFKQIAADQTSSQRRVFSLNEVVQEVLLSHRPMLKKSPIDIRTDIPAGIRMDSFPGPLGQVLGNLVTNAVLHAYDGYARGTVSVSARADGGDSVEIAVRDEGRGISEQDLKRIFDPFFTTRMGRGGTGLGLGICHNIVTEALGGRIRVESRVGEGATFELRLPLVAPAMKP